MLESGVKQKASPKYTLATVRRLSDTVLEVKKVRPASNPIPQDVSNPSTRSAAVRSQAGSPSQPGGVNNNSTSNRIGGPQKCTSNTSSKSVSKEGSRVAEQGELRVSRTRTCSGIAEGIL